MMSTGAASPVFSDRPQAYMRLAELLGGSRIALAVHVAVKLRIADMLGHNAKSPEELSLQAGLPSPSLKRLLRALSYVGVFREDIDGRFLNTEVSAFLRTDADPSLREMSLILNDEAMLRGWQHLEQVLETGNPVYASVNGQTFFEQVAADPERSELMARYMNGIYGPEGPRIASGFPFGGFARIMDVGGGQGHILADILRAHPHLEGALFDLPRTTAVARRFLTDAGLSNRCKVFAGDFLEAVVPGYDAYFIKSTLHDWDDDKSIQILRNIRDAMPPNGRVLVTEIVIEPGKPIGHPHRFVDLEMMVNFGGKERTAEEFAGLLQGASLQLQRVHPIDGSFFSIVEGSRA
jgi:hypothetical protein